MLQVIAPVKTSISYWGLLGLLYCTIYEEYAILYNTAKAIFFSFALISEYNTMQMISNSAKEKNL